MKVSIVLSTYNGSEYIVEQLDSLRCQSYQADEVLISDDCSTDNTAEIIEAYIKEYNLAHWKFVRNNQNNGWRKNFMELLKSATGDILFTCDQDDVWLSDKIEVMKNAMEQNPNINVLVSKYLEFFEDGSTRIMPKNRYPQDINKQILVKNFTAIPFPGCTYCIKKEFAIVAQKYWQDDFPHDSILWRLAMFSDGLYIMDKVLIKMRKHNKSTFTQESKSSKNKVIKRNSLDYEERVFNGMLRYIEDEPQIFEKNKKRAIVEKSLKWNSIRKNFYDKRNPFYGLMLLKYIKYYPNFKRYLGDWYWIFLS